jgi:hypothetical protein
MQELLWGAANVQLEEVALSFDTTVHTLFDQQIAIRVYRTETDSWLACNGAIW